MSGKPTNSTWHVMENLIKATISAWPIIFAAVVAQVLKAWATFKVERGIKLMELEQLVGSNSFGSAIKQPLMLRKLNLLTLVLLLVWCLSPLGTQALQRVYTKTPNFEESSMEVKYLDTTGYNQAFSDFNPEGPPIGFEDLYANPEQLQQEIGLYFAANFIPNFNLGTTQSEEGGVYQDQYNHPHIQWMNTTRTDPYEVSGYGLPVIMEKSRFGPIGSPSSGDESVNKVKDAAQNTDFEIVEFDVDTAYFDVACEDWRTIKGQDIQDEIDAMNAATHEFESEPGAWEASDSQTLWLKLDIVGNASDYSAIELASQIKADASDIGDLSGNQTLNLTADFSYLRCNYSQVFVTANLYCIREGSSKSGMLDCGFVGSKLIPEDRIKNRTLTFDWVAPMQHYGSPSARTSTTTPSKSSCALEKT
jgi:hypothetical protein